MKSPDRIDDIERLTELEPDPIGASDDQEVIGDLFRLYQAEFDLVTRQPGNHLIAVAVFENLDDVVVADLLAAVLDEWRHRVFQRLVFVRVKDYRPSGLRNVFQFDVEGSAEVPGFGLSFRD